MITIHHCGETYFADDAHLGRQIKCVVCGEILVVARQQPTPVARAEKVAEGFKYASSVTKREQIIRLFRSNKSRKSLLFGLLAGGALILLVGIAGIVSRQVPGSASPPDPSAAQQPRSIPHGSTTSQPTQISQVPLARLPVSLATGTRLTRPSGPRGRGTVTIVNGTNLDAVVKLVHVSFRASVCQTIYIRAGDRSVLGHVGPGRYRLRFALGKDWDFSRKQFISSASLSEFEDPLLFEEREEGERFFYNEFELTLQAVPFGNARTHSIGESTFSEGDSEE